VHRNLCAGGKRNEESDFERDLAGAGSREDDEAAKLELTYSTMSAINRVRPTLGTLGCVHNSG
jgi:hypothetical protein